MSSRSLNGGDLNLNNLTVTNGLTLNDVEVSGDCSVNVLTASDFTTNTITANTLTVHDSLAVNAPAYLSDDVNMYQNASVTGNLTVGGELYLTNYNTLPMEILWFNITGNASATTETMILQNNITSTTNYSVFPSFYYGFTGSGGTYNIGQTCNAVSQVMITGRTNTEFQWYLNKTTGDNINVMIYFLIIYAIGNSNYPSTWS